MTFRGFLEISIAENSSFCRPQVASGEKAFGSPPWMLELQATIADMCIENEGWKLTLGPIACVYVRARVILRSYDCV